jgi:enoyl-CoA hydratase/carnithine racemase
MAKYLTLEHLGQSAIITINNPPANVWTIASLRELAAVMTDLQADSAVRAVVITGAGDAFFCAGADLNLFSKAASRKWPSCWMPLPRLLRRCVTIPVLLSPPSTVMPWVAGWNAR